MGEEKRKKEEEDEGGLRLVGASTRSVGDGPWNMAVDSALLESVASGEAPATLRFYAWDSPCLSLGRFQAIERHVDLEGCRRHGVSLVRRVTGGKALLHLPEDLTYALVLPSGHALLKRSIVESYGEITRAFADALAALGLTGSTFGQERSGGAAGAVCFAEHLVESLLVHGRKFLGSAQLRRQGCLLQHGSLKLRFDAEVEGALYVERGSRDRAYWTRLVEETVCSLEVAMGRRPAWEELTGSIGRAMGRRLGLELGKEEDLEEKEKRRATALRAGFLELERRPSGRPSGPLSRRC